jgi:type IV secretory pathway VirB2 component (pilin)
LASAAIVFAQTPIQNPTDISETNPIGGIFNTIFLFLIGIVGGLAIIFIVIGGIRYIMAQGDPKATDSAKNQITAAIIGLVVALLAVVIVLIVGNLLGASGLNVPGQAPT